VSSTVEVADVLARCARPTGDAHGRTADGPTQHTSGKDSVKACEGPRLTRWGEKRVSAAKNGIEAEAP